MPETAAFTCPACRARVTSISLADPVDYEYGVVPEGTYSYLRCDQCASEYLSPRPGDGALADFYPENYHAHNDDHGLIAAALVRIRGWFRGRKYHSLLQGKPRGTLFDVGAGDCRHFEELSRYAHWDFAGVEILDSVAQAARNNGYHIETGTLEQIDLAPHLARYDVVSMNHVLEHVSDPVLVVERCRQLLKPGGYLIGQLPTNSTWETVFGGAWGGYHYPRHLQLFSRQGLAQLLEAGGFSGIRITSAPHCQAAISMQNQLLARGWSMHLDYGRTRIYGLLLLLSLPLEALAWLFNRSGTVDFIARRPAA